MAYRFNKLLNKFISKKRVYLVAEAGVNHNGKIATAKKLISEAKKAGADAVKFQLFPTENVCLSLYAAAAK